MAHPAWICEGCEKPSPVRSDIWNCVECHEEICERCFDRLAHCKRCGIGKTDEELRLAANAAGYDFEPPIPPEKT